MYPVFTSESHEQFRKGLEEIHRLEQFVRIPQGLSVVSINAIHRASTVILCSRLESYFEHVFIEGWEFLESRKAPGASIPRELRVRVALVESRRLIDTDRDDPAKIDSLAGSVLGDIHHLWEFQEPFSTGFAHVEKLAARLSNPDPRNLVWFFKPYGFDNILSSIELMTDGRLRASTLEKNLDNFVEARHRIAHGDERVMPTSQDVSQYLEQCRMLCREVDAVLGLKIEGLGLGFPWRGRPRECKASIPISFCDTLTP